MAAAWPLKLKYRVKKAGQKGPSGEKPAKPKNRNKLNVAQRAKLAPQPRMVMRVGPTGKRRMVKT